MLDDGSVSIPSTARQYAYSKTIQVKKWNGGVIEVQVGYVKQHPEDTDIRLIKSWKVKGGLEQTQVYNIKPKDWTELRNCIEGLVPELKQTMTDTDIKNAVEKVANETELLELISKYPDLLKKTEKIDILLLPEDQKKSLSRLLTVGGEMANTIIEKLSHEEVKDLADFGRLLEQMQLSTINALVTHITSRLSIIDLFEKVIHNDESFEKKGDDSVHNFLKQNMWMVDRNFSILHDDRTLKKIILENWGETVLGKKGDQRPDFLCMVQQECIEDENNIVIIEIKRPSVKIVLDHVNQLMEYRTILQKYSGKSIKQFKSYLIGRELDETVQQNPLASSGFVTKTYSDFIQEARSFYREYKSLVEKEKFAF